MAKVGGIETALKEAGARAAARERQKLTYNKRVAIAASKLRKSGPAIKEIAAQLNLDLSKLREKRSGNPLEELAKIKMGGPRHPKPYHPVKLHRPPVTDDPAPVAICYFPANDGFVPNNPPNKYDAKNASLRVYMESSGVASWLGYTLSPVTTDVQWAYLRYAFMPPHDGTLTAIAAIFATGSVRVGSQPIVWNPFSWAEATVTFDLNIWQQGRLVARDSELVCNLHSDTGQADSVGFNETPFGKICAGYVTTQAPVIVEFVVTMAPRGNSDTGYAVIDFTEGLGIHVPELCLFLGPPIPTIVN